MVRGALSCVFCPEQLVECLAVARAAIQSAGWIDRQPHTMKVQARSKAAMVAESLIMVKAGTETRHAGFYCRPGNLSPPLAGAFSPSSDLNVRRIPSAARRILFLFASHWCTHPLLVSGALSYAPPVESVSNTYDIEAIAPPRTLTLDVQWKARRRGQGRGAVRTCLAAAAEEGQGKLEPLL